MNINYFDCRFCGGAIDKGEYGWEYPCNHPLNKYGGECGLENKWERLTTMSGWKKALISFGVGIPLSLLIVWLLHELKTVTLGLCP